MFVKFLQSYNGKALFVLLSLSALSLSQAMVLCVGEDGHVAVEPVGHNHCADDTHRHGPDPTGSQEGNSSHSGRTCCRPCNGIPIPLGAGDECTPQQVSKLSLDRPAALPVIFFLSLDDAGELLPSEALCQPPPDCASLRTIVLQV